MCDELPVDCATKHAAPKLRLRCSQVNRQWNGPCPVCHSPRSLSLTIEHGRNLYHCNRKPGPGKPACSQDELMAKLAEELPGCVTAARTGTGTRTRRPPPDIRGQVSEIVLDTTSSAATLRLQLLMLSEDLTAREAAAKLGYSRSTFYAAVGNLGRGKR